MGFFDDLGKKANQLSKDVATKAKNLSEITRLNREINLSKRSIDEEYKKIGAKVFEAFKSGEKDERFAEFCETITSSFDFIKESEAKILELKDITICPECGAELDKETQFCGKCGAKIERPEKPEPEEEPVDGTKCKECGEIIPSGSDFCPSCGAKKDA